MMIPATRPAQAIDAARLPVMLTMLRLPNDLLIQRLSIRKRTPISPASSSAK
jgi:hypothetical protein